MTNLDLTVQRSNCFKLLAACFYEPDKELFIQEELCENLATLLMACGCTDAANEAIAMKEELEESSSEDLIVEYARLFVGPFELIAPPYGSAYLEETRRLMGDSTIAVQKMYQKAGLSLDIKEAPDHIALELEFMHYLCLRDAEDSNEQDHKFAVMQSEFLMNYLGPWVGDFCESIRKGTDKGFYTHLADCLEGFVVAFCNTHKTVKLFRKSEDTCVSRASA